MMNDSIISEQWVRDGAILETSQWPLMQTPFPGLVLSGSYIYFVKILGPSLMKDRKPYSLKLIMFIYNVIMVAVNLYLFIEAGKIGWFGKYKLFCETMNPDKPADNMRMAELGWYFMINKFVEFMDTIFFILRKRFELVTLLHVVHHSTVPLNIWIGTKYYPVGHITFFPFINAFVHVIMYSYYALAALGPSVRKYLWWKKYITTIQMTQFAIAFLHGLFAFTKECDDIPRIFVYLSLFNAVLFFVLFYDFYKTAYRKKKPDPMEDSQTSSPPNGVPVETSFVESASNPSTTVKRKIAQVITTTSGS